MRLYQGDVINALNSKGTRVREGTVGFWVALVMSIGRWVVVNVLSNKFKCSVPEFVKGLSIGRWDVINVLVRYQGL